MTMIRTLCLHFGNLGRILKTGLIQKNFAKDMHNPALTQRGVHTIQQVELHEVFLDSARPELKDEPRGGPFKVH